MNNTKNKNDMDDPNHRVMFGKVIKMLREYNNDTLRSMAIKVGMSHAHLCNIERGVVGCSVEMLEKVEKVYGYNPYVLMWMVDKYDGYEISDYKEFVKNIIVNVGY